VDSAVILHDVFKVNINLFVVIFVLLCFQYCFITLFHIGSKSAVHKQILCIDKSYKIIFFYNKRNKSESFSDIFIDL